MSCVTVTYYCTVLHCGFSPKIRLRIERKIRCLKWKNILQDKNHSNWLKTNSSKAKIFLLIFALSFPVFSFYPLPKDFHPFGCVFRSLNIPGPIPYSTSWNFICLRWVSSQRRMDIVLVILFLGLTGYIV